MRKYFMKNKEEKKVTATFVATIMVLTVFSAMILTAAPVGAGTTSIWTTDEFGNPVNDFTPGSLVYIQGSGFSSDVDVELNITRPDGWLEEAPDSVPIDRFPSDVLPHTDTNGDFSDYIYDLDGIVGQYLIQATDGVHTATFTFTDGVHVDFSQYANGPTYEKWIGSILQASNSIYYEGMSVPQRTAFVDIDPTTDDIHTLTFKHQATKSGFHAYDWITSWNQGNTPPLTYIPWGEDIGPHVTEEVCGALYNQTGANEWFLDVPDDPYVSKDGSTQPRIDAYEAVHGNRQIRICGNQPITSASWNSMAHDVANGADTGDSFIEYELTWTSNSTQILIQMGGHLAMSGNDSMAWGPGLGASQISGGPYHFKLDYIDDDSLGSQDNQIKGADIISYPGEIIVQKNTDPAGHAQSFEFVPSWGDNFFLTDGQSNSSGYLEAGTYSVSEIVPSGWTLDSATCSDGSDPSAINLEEGETVYVIFNLANSICCGW